MKLRIFLLLLLTFAAAAYNLVRIRNLITANAGGKA